MRLFHARIYNRCAGEASSLGGGRALTWGGCILTWGRRVACWWGIVPYARVHNIYLETFFVPCFIFITQCIDNQYFQEMKHWYSMFHFLFQCFSGVSLIGVWFLSHWGFKSLPLGFCFSPTEFFGKGGVVNKKWNIETQNETLKPKMKHWNPKWNIET